MSRFLPVIGKTSVRSDEIVVAPAAELVAAVRERFVALAREAVSARGRFTVALSGGTTPKKIYEQLAGEALPWERIEIFWGDERTVPPEHEQSNFRMTTDAWLSKVTIPAANIHRIRG